MLRKKRRLRRTSGIGDVASVHRFEFHPLHRSTKNVKVVEGESFNVENLIFDVKSFIAGVFK
jgi:hypothetical protein